ncbi:hypothetical protein ABF190_000976 [Flavobacterium psychrophilum]|uniref:hypothetical protein n=1 Tax=Flavobacterium psychrophilum TaxID=96345 RepID=UPI00090BA5F7|nr:hypothetical protein [Flavobacterium psychrophilum]EKT2070858.1 hypothetical protein [Flavobacterium psychrophilum]EKT4490378.1 hypothetical protein [Flavobacterium psychrophilum]SHI09421.1 Protein of unknown function [Flavobacterium psychrophilum]SNB00311.1 conserved hypothetical protein [Flavobacterium psychrophilum]
MPIDFFENKCKSTSNKIEFGLCDDSSPAENPAYINEDDDSKWIGIVKNNTNKEIEFIAIDSCIDIRRPDGKLESRCDGLLSFDTNLIFVELKSRESKKWFKTGREQLTNTIRIFKDNYDISKYNSISGNVCNGLRPQSHAGQATNIQQFFDETGLILKGDRTIKI